MNIIELAREVGGANPASLYGRTDYWVLTEYELERFAALIRAQVLKEVALKPGQYVIRYNADGEFGQKTGWLYRDGGDPCVITGKPVYVWRPLSDLISPQPRKRLTDEEIQRVYREFMLYQDGLTPSGMQRVARIIEAAVWGEKA